MSVQLRSYPDDVKCWQGDLPVEAPGTTARVGGLASVWAVTRVKPEQAPKGTMRAPSCLPIGEGRWGRLEQPSDEDRSARRGTGYSTHASNEVRPRETCGGARFGAQPAFGVGPPQESEGPIGPMKPAKAGGGKGPWFRVRTDEPRGRGLA